jgi:outer membrane immunogenic protein
VKKLALASTALIALAGTAAAADLPRRVLAPMAPVAPVFTWSGFYLGTHSGVLFTESRVRTSGNAANTIFDVDTNRRPPSLSIDDWDTISGAQIGYNLQFGAFVAGIEADISYVGLEARETFVSTLDDRSQFRQELDFFGTVRGRIGFVFDQVFVYATGGFAYGDVTNRVRFFNPAGTLQFAGRSSDIETGYAVGGGVEFVLPPALQLFNIVGPLLGASAVTVKAEYLYFDLGDRNVTVNAIPGVGLNSYTSNFETSGHIGRIGFNYRFGS